MVTVQLALEKHAGLLREALRVTYIYMYTHMCIHVYMCVHTHTWKSQALRTESTCSPKVGAFNSKAFQHYFSVCLYSSQANLLHFASKSLKCCSLLWVGGLALLLENIPRNRPMEKQENGTNKSKRIRKIVGTVSSGSQALCYLQKCKMCKNT